MLSERLKSAIPLIAIVTIAFFAPMSWGAPLFGLLAVAMLCTACSEVFSLLAPSHRQRLQWLVTATGLLLALIGTFPWLSLHFPSLSNALTSLAPLQHALPALAMLLAFWLSFRETPSRENVNGLLIAAGAGCFICWQLSYFVRIYFYPGSDHSRLLLFYLIAVTKMADVGAFAAGSLCAKRPGGNHHLAPLVSPKKSWEGLVGGTIFSLATSLVFVACCGDKLGIVAGNPVIGWTSAAIIGILASPVGLLGDLAESAIKRAANAKDSGKLPGIGGVLDTLDSLLPMGPLFYTYLQFVA